MKSRQSLQTSLPHFISPFNEVNEVEVCLGSSLLLRSGCFNKLGENEVNVASCRQPGFFSPDQYVANSTFSQDFNRYSYCRNNPLSYVDPSGQNFWNAISTFLFFPARMLSETFTLINDKINGVTRPNGYFNGSYLLGKTEPGADHTIYPCTQLSHNDPGRLPTGGGSYNLNFVGTGLGLGADNEWSDHIIKKFNEQEYVRKVGSKKLTWLPKNVAASAGIDLKVGKFVLGTYVGKVDGTNTNVFESKKFGKWHPGDWGYGGVTLPEIGIILGEGVYDNDKQTVYHEFGHVLQYKKVGPLAYYRIIGKESFLSAIMDGQFGWKHKDFWTETWANYLSSNYFTDFDWDYEAYPAKDISWFNLLRLRAAMFP
jgi:hypothetical protein